MSAESGFEASGQGVAVEWFGQETGCSGLQRSLATDLDGKGRDENDWRRDSLGAQQALQLKFRSSLASARQ